jgi:tRNA(Ile)-lysidine synthase
MLTTTRAEVEAYCAARGLEPRRDETNADTRFLRNRLRREATGRVVFDRERWQALSVPEQRALLRRAVQRLRRHLRDVDFTPLEAAVRFLQTAAASRHSDLMAGLCVTVTPGLVVVHPWGTEAERGAHAGPLLDAEGGLAAGWKFAAEAVTADEWAPGQPAPRAPSRWTEYADASALEQPLCLRARQPGDRFQPLGLGGHSTKVADFLVNQKIPAGLRDRWPLVVAGGQVVWVAGLRLDERYKVQ